MMNLLGIWGVIGVAIWLIAAWVGLPRYARCFQDVGYNYGRYRRALAPEFDYTIIFSLIIGLYVAGLGAFVVAGLLSVSPYIAAAAYVAAFILAVRFAPHKPLTAQPVILGARSRRLLFTAFWIELIPVAVAQWITSSSTQIMADPRNSPEASFAVGLLLLGFGLMVWAIVGPIAFILTRFALPVANLINTPIEGLLNATRR